jgi:hypothetical protein
VRFLAIAFGMVACGGGCRGGGKAAEGAGTEVFDEELGI